MSWQNTIGRVSFINCEPLFHGLDKSWNVLPAPPAWLTGHLLRRDCILAPIPAADYARNHAELFLLPEIAISSKGEVGSVLLFSELNISEIKTVALPSDSATSVQLLKYLLTKKNIEPKYTEMGPDLQTMLASNDACLLIGDRALDAAREYPDYVILDLGKEWLRVTGKPMVFGVFAARRDSDMNIVKTAHSALKTQLEKFETDKSHRDEVIKVSSQKSSQPETRLESYFGEVINRVEPEDMSGLELFLKDACKMEADPVIAW